MNEEKEENLLKYQYIDIDKTETEILKVKGKHKQEKIEKDKKGVVTISGDAGAFKNNVKQSKLSKSIFDTIDLFFEVIGIKSSDKDEKIK